MNKTGIEGKTPMVNKLGIWLLMITITILFGSLGLGFMLTSSSDSQFTLPWMFYVNSLVLLISSLLLHYGWVNRIKHGKAIMLWPAVGLGVLFLICQVFTWWQLYDSGLTIRDGGIKISYLYILSGLHAAHIIGGLFFLIYVAASYQRQGRKHLETAVFFWHFLGILWLYLLVLMILN